MIKVEVPTTLTVDGKEFPVTDFSETVQRLVVIHTEWRNDVNAERLALTKTEAALRSVDAELAQLVAKELAEKATAPAEATPAQ